MSPGSRSFVHLFVGPGKQNYAVVFIIGYISGHQFLKKKAYFLILKRTSGRNVKLVIPLRIACTMPAGAKR